MSAATWGWFAALLGWTIIVSFYDLEGGAGFEPVDCWVAQTAREMSENAQAEGWRGLMAPQFSGETRLQKSPGAYWAVCLAAYLRGTEVDETAVRIPNAVASVLMVVTIFWLALRIAGERAAIFAGFAAASSMCLLYWSHRGSSDLGVAALMTISLACLWIGSEATQPGPKRVSLWLLGYFCAGLAMLYKMPLPIVCVGLPAVLYVVVRNRWRVFASGWHLVGLLLFLLPWLPWAVWIIWNEPAALDKWRTEYWDRATGDLPNVQNNVTWYFYLMYIGVALLFTMPYSLSLPQAIFRAFRKSEGVDRNGQWFLLLWFAGLFAFFTAATGKETRYFLPVMPPLFVMLGCELAAFFDPKRRASPALDRAAFWAVAVGAPAAIVGLTWYAYKAWYQPTVTAGMFSAPTFVGAMSLSGAIFAAGAVLAAALYMRRRESAAFAALAGTMFAAWAVAWPLLLPLLSHQAPYRDFAAQLRTLDETQRGALRQIAHQDPRIIWYADVRFPRLIDQLELLEMQGGTRDIEWEMRKYGERMIEELASDNPVLFVIHPLHYAKFQALAPLLLAEDDRDLPENHVWIAAREGRIDRRYVLFGNRKPPWPAPQLDPRFDKLIARFRREYSENNALSARVSATELTGE